MADSLRAKTATRRQTLLVGALSVIGLAAQQPDEDGVLYDKVHRRLNNHRALRIRDLRVTVVDRVVTIQGTVRSQSIKRRASKIASIRGVAKVVNNLEVGA